MIEGSCLCGSIKYEVEIIPDKIFNCHCQFCRKAHGADYVSLALVKASTLTIDDQNSHLTEHLNDIGGYRAFCSNCGTRMMNYASDKNMYCAITLSTIDSPFDLRPIAHVNTESKAKWCTPSDDIPSFEAFPPSV